MFWQNGKLTALSVLNNLKNYSACFAAYQPTIPLYVINESIK